MHMGTWDVRVLKSMMKGKGLWTQECQGHLRTAWTQGSCVANGGSDGAKGFPGTRQSESALFRVVGCVLDLKMFANVGSL